MSTEHNKYETKIKSGNLITFTQGEYSDYGIMDYVVALGDFDLSEQKIQFLDYIEKTQDDEDDINQHQFISWLIQQGHVESINNNVREIHLGSYSFDPLF